MSVFCSWFHCSRYVLHYLDGSFNSLDFPYNFSIPVITFARLLDCVDKYSHSTSIGSAVQHIVHLLLPLKHTLPDPSTWTWYRQIHRQSIEMRLFKGTKTGFGCTILNVFRAMNIIALISVIAASFVMLVKTFIVSRFYFFDAVTHLVTAFVSSE